MQNIKDYMNLTREERKERLNLNEPCIEIGGHSLKFVGLLAYHLKTTIPDKSDKVCVCHGCCNEGCSNVNHLYWGSHFDNHLDAKESGSWQSPWERTVKKYGLEEAKRMNRRPNTAGRGGRANKGKPKSEEHKRKISESLRKYASMMKR